MLEAARFETDESMMACRGKARSDSTISEPTIARRTGTTGRMGSLAIGGEPRENRTHHILVVVSVRPAASLAGGRDPAAPRLIRKSLQAHPRTLLRIAPEERLETFDIKGEMLGRALGTEETPERRDLERAGGVQIPVALGEQAQVYTRTLQGERVVVPMQL